MKAAPLSARQARAFRGRKATAANWRRPAMAAKRQWTDVRGTMRKAPPRDRGRPT